MNNGTANSTGELRCDQCTVTWRVGTKRTVSFRIKKEGDIVTTLCTHCAPEPLEK